MFAFEGDFKSRRNINLGGHNTRQDKSALLRKAQLEREQREAERLRQKSASLIQAVWRSYCVRARAKNAERAIWDRIAGVSNPCDESVLQLGKRLLFFFDSATDAQRLLLFLRVIVEAGAGGQPRCTEILTKQELAGAWLHQLSRLVEVVVVLLKPTTNANVLCSEHILFLETISDPQSFVGIPNGSISLSTLFRTMLRINLYATAGLYIRCQMDLPDPQRSPHTSSLLQLLLDLYRHAPDRDVARQILSLLISQVLTLPLVFQRMSSSDRSRFIGMLALDELFETILAQLASQPESLSLADATNLLVSIMAIGKDQLQGAPLSSQILYFRALKSALLRLPRGYLAITEGSEPDDSDSDSESDDPSSGRRNQLGTVDPALHPHISQLIHPGFLSILSTHLGSATLSAEVISELCALVCVLIFQFRNKKFRIVNAFLYNGSSILRNLLTFVMGTTISRKIDETASLQYADVVDPTRAQDWAVLLFFAETLSQAIIIMGDDEFYDDRNPVKSHVPNIINIFKHCAFTIYWNGASEPDGYIDGMAVPIKWMNEAFKLLLHQIYARHSRRESRLPEVWLISSDLDTNLFMQQAVLEDVNAEEPATLSQLKMVRPYQAVLSNIPFVIPFEARVAIFRECINLDRRRVVGELGWIAPAAQIKIHRSSVFEDGFKYLHPLGPNLKKRVAISFVSEHGLDEAGIDGGGVFKEFLTALSKQVFDDSYGLFMTTSKHLLYPTPCVFRADPQRLAYYEFVGRILGKALYDGILLDVGFAGFFLSKWLGRQSYLDDLASLDSELYSGLVMLKDYPKDVEKDLGLYFSINVKAETGEIVTIDLAKDGSAIPVTNENRHRYIYMVSDYKLNKQLDQQCQAFFRGLSTLIEPRWLRMFNQQELQILLGGASTPIDIDDLRNNTTYGGDFHELHPTIRHFWKVVEGFDNEQRRKLIKFATSCPRPPLLGFKELSPGFNIRSAEYDNERLPTASTCVNLLKMPPYTSEEILRSKLLYAINAEAGFDLS
ncbi:uncharacterized protein BJ171DRAFT_216009 [Polychytrium aggregatum]|uniref:uncharacterized protein n=1 Tax=Polychytrium aggregatum TaxID=110093 RepID=UPI0022FE4C8E|nr:uncharacterized protein BJ171DRAFT_216009 [Polychytrium aggregatum]KAI9199312.1 hypothetical protein BJ171DRAFT_216009 [Polychytrium aggregatum]